MKRDFSNLSEDELFSILANLGESRSDFRDDVAAEITNRWKTPQPSGSFAKFWERAENFKPGTAPELKFPTEEERKGQIDNFVKGPYLDQRVNRIHISDELIKLIKLMSTGR